MALFILRTDLTGRMDPDSSSDRHIYGKYGRRDNQTVVCKYGTDGCRQTIRQSYAYMGWTGADRQSDSPMQIWQTLGLPPKQQQLENTCDITF